MLRDSIVLTILRPMLKLVFVAGSGICVHEGLLHANAAVWKSSNCRECTCSDGLVQCYDITCPALKCSFIFKPDYYCCEICCPNQGSSPTIRKYCLRVFLFCTYVYVQLCASMSAINVSVYNKWMLLVYYLFVVTITLFFLTRLLHKYFTSKPL